MGPAQRLEGPTIVKPSWWGTGKEGHKEKTRSNGWDFLWRDQTRTYLKYALPKPKKNTRFILCSGRVSLLLLQFVGNAIILGHHVFEMENPCQTVSSTWSESRIRDGSCGDTSSQVFPLWLQLLRCTKELTGEDAVPSLTGTSIETLRIDDIEACDPFGLKNPDFFWLSCSRASLYLKEVFQLMICWRLSND